MGKTFVFDPSLFPGHSLRRMEPQWAAAFGGRLARIDPWLRLGYSAEGLARYLSACQGDVEAFALSVGSVSAACLTVRPNWLRGPLLELLAVLPEHQGQRLGQALVLWLAGEAKRQKQANLWTIGSAFNQGALEFYRRQGFHEVGELPNLIRHGETEILLRLDLAAA